MTACATLVMVVDGDAVSDVAVNSSECKTHERYCSRVIGCLAEREHMKRLQRQRLEPSEG